MRDDRNEIIAEDHDVIGEGRETLAIQSVYQTKCAATFPVSFELDTSPSRLGAVSRDILLRSVSRCDRVDLSVSTPEHDGRMAEGSQFIKRFRRVSNLIR